MEEVLTFLLLMKMASTLLVMLPEMYPSQFEIPDVNVEVTAHSCSTTVSIKILNVPNTTSTNSMCDQIFKKVTIFSRPEQW